MNVSEFSALLTLAIENYNKYSRAIKNRVRQVQQSSI